MNKILSYLLIAMVVIGFSACRNSNERKIIAKWKIAYLTDGRPILPEDKELVDKKMAENKKIDYFDIKGSGDMEVKMMGRIQKMKWKLSSDGKKITARDAVAEVDEVLDITELTDKKMVLAYEGLDKIVITLEK